MHPPNRSKPKYIENHAIRSKMCIRQAFNDEVVKIGYNGSYNLLDSSLSPRKWERSVSALVTSPINTPIHNLTLQVVLCLCVALAFFCFFSTGDYCKKTKE